MVTMLKSNQSFLVFPYRDDCWKMYNNLYFGLFLTLCAITWAFHQPTNKTSMAGGV